ncbi:hypothetical protein DAI22_08g124500 [Oryza sativa Japonica Group]|nr:hypothetical protein DAI22_08g124500 [Oryza sativa Japonica Group]
MISYPQPCTRPRTNQRTFVGCNSLYAKQADGCGQKLRATNTAAVPSRLEPYV